MILAGDFSNFCDARTAWVLTDGTKGMEVQSLGLSDRLGLKTTRLELQPPSLTRAFPQLAASGLFPLPKALKQALAAGGWPDVIITTGRRMAGLSILCRKKSQGRSRTIHIQDPRLSARYFDLVIVPSHDRLRGDNVLVTTGSLNALTDAKIKAAAGELPIMFNGFSRPVIAVMVGGSNRRYHVSEGDLYEMAEYFSALAHAMDGSLVFIPSRRSHDMTTHCITKMMGHGLITTPTYWIWDGAGKNPYPGILGFADAVVVTSDSVNMTSEACLSGKPVYRYNFRDESGRIGLFHKIMEKGGYVRPMGFISRTSFPGDAGHRLDEAGRIAKLLKGCQMGDA